MSTQTGFYNVSLITQYGKKYYRYGVKNKLIKKTIQRQDILQLKKAVLKANLLWGIIDKEEAKKHKGTHALKTLQGQYGIQIK